MLICRNCPKRTIFSIHMGLIRRQRTNVFDQGIPALRSYLGLKILRRPNTWVSFVYNLRLYMVLASDVVFHPKGGKNYYRTEQLTTENEIMASAINRRKVSTVCGHAILAEA
jgi:hypothetical protein